MPGKNHSEKIEALEVLTNNLDAQMRVYNVKLEGLVETLKKYSEFAEGHGTKITIIEQQLLIMVDYKKYIETVAGIQQDLVAIKKDIENLRGWKDDLKKEKEEASRRRAAFGPNVTAALISGFIAILILLINHFLNPKK